MKRFQFSFEEIDYENPVHDRPMSSELSVHLDDWAPWTEVLNFFAHFLEGIGYVGVLKKLDDLNVFGNDKDWEIDDETPSNS
jgi:hypothetical protein